MRHQKRRIDAEESLSFETRVEEGGQRGVEALTSMFFLTPQKRAAPAA